MKLLAAGRTRLVVLLVDVAVLLGGLVGVSTIGPSSRVVAERTTSTTTSSRTADDASSNATVVTAVGDHELADRGGSTTTTVTARQQRGTSTTTTVTSNTATDDGLAATRNGMFKTRVVTEDSGDPDGSSTDIEQVKVSTSRRTATEVRQVFSQNQVAEEDADDPASWSEEDYTDEKVRWSRDGMFLSTEDAGEGTCTPGEILMMKLPLAAGSTWKQHIECSGGDGSASEPSGKATMDLSGKVTGSKQVMALGRPMQVWEVVIDMKMSFSMGTMSFDSTAHHVAQFSPELGYDVHSVTDTRDNDPDEPSTEHETRDLLSFTPA